MIPSMLFDNCAAECTVERCYGGTLLKMSPEA